MLVMGHLAIHVFGIVYPKETLLKVSELALVRKRSEV